VSRDGTPQSQSAARGAVTVIAFRWTDRLIGIASTLILARLLMPQDFGIVAMASLVVALIDTLLDLGVHSALIQNRNAARPEYDTAWTLRLAQNLVAAALIAGPGAVLAAGYFQDDRVTDVLRIMALTIVISGFENIGIVTFQKNMEFGREFRFLFLRRIVGFVVTVALAIWFRSYWAMIVGTLVSRAFGVWLSYRLHDYRPQLSLARLGALWSFSQWVLLRNIGSYGAAQTDKLVVGRREGASPLGAYALADEIAAMPTGELLAPIGRVLFPAFVRAAEEPNELRRVFLLAVGVMALVGLPAGVGLVLVAPLAVPLLLGPQWAAAVPLVQTLALFNALAALTNGCSYLLLAMGHVRALALAAWLQFALLVGLAVLAFPSAGGEGVALIRLAAGGCGALLLWALVLRIQRQLRPGDVASALWRPLLASGMMALALSGWLPSTNIGQPFVGLVADIAFGALVYVGVLLIAWRLSGWADGAEAYLLEKSGLKSRLHGLLK
jgi:lipopolysaccharide exporter